MSKRWLRHLPPPPPDTPLLLSSPQTHAAFTVLQGGVFRALLPLLKGKTGSGYLVPSYLISVISEKLCAWRPRRRLTCVSFSLWVAHLSGIELNALPSSLCLFSYTKLTASDIYIFTVFHSTAIFLSKGHVLTYIILIALWVGISTTLIVWWVKFSLKDSPSLPGLEVTKWVCKSRLT